MFGQSLQAKAADLENSITWCQPVHWLLDIINVSTHNNTIHMFSDSLLPLTFKV